MALREENHPMHIKLKDIVMDFPIASGVKRAVDNVSLTIGDGERYGIIGRNGAGKTTLLQIMAGLLRQTSGQLDVTGHVNCVMTLGVGLREEMTGRENIYVDGELNGKSRQDIDALQDEIVEFADIGEFMDHPVRTYSTGMKARLTFALITFIEPEILIIDETLSVGDAEFGRKATKKMRDLCDRGKIIILVSHSMPAIRDMCTRCIWMEDGRVVMDGSSVEVTEAYLESVRKKDEEEMRLRFQRRIGPRTFYPGYAIEQMEFVDGSGIARLVWRSDEEVTVRFVALVHTPLHQPDFKLSFEKIDGNIIMENWARKDGCSLDAIEGQVTFEIDLGKLEFGGDTYEVQLALYGDQEAGTHELLATYCEVIKVEKPADCLDSPAYFCPVEIRAEKLSNNSGEL